jgi:flagellum-specific ATP synthase
MAKIDVSKFHQVIKNIDPIRLNGKITQVIGLVMESQGPHANLGELCYVFPRQRGGDPIAAEVVGFRNGIVLLMPLGEMQGVGPGCEVVATNHVMGVGVGPQLLGRVLDGLGSPIDGKGPVNAEFEYPTSCAPPSPFDRQRISEPLSLGVKAIDGLLTCGRGQRLGIFAGSGVGKSTLMGMIARNTEADISVIALIGERGREVREFIERDLGEEGLRRSVVVVATSDQPALVRIKGAMVATAIAEYFRDQSRHVMLMMDSVTRFAMAQREVGLTIGEPPATRGYPPSVFALLPKLLERSGAGVKGTITGMYTVLVDGDDINEPITDTVRSILDGHIMLSRNLASKNHYPAIDVLNSVSRVMIDIVDRAHLNAGQEMRNMLAAYREAEDLINIGAYATGSNPRIDRAIRKIAQLEAFLQQDINASVPFDDTKQRLLALMSE